MKRIKLKILAMLASLTVVFGVQSVVITASADAPSAESVSVEELPQETTEDIKNPTFEDFLAAVQKEADRYGYGDEYAAAMDAIKTAATTKQVTLSTIFSALVALAVIGYIIYSKVKDKSLKTDMKKLLSYIEKQSNGINGLIDGTNENGKIEADTHKLASISQQELQHLTKGLCYLTTAFMTFSESHRYQASKKEQVELNCVKALKEVEKSEEAAHEA